jgi:glycosyltransferase involved in cell wall biosynthesis
MHYISILIPIYNGVEFLEQSLASVIAQTYKNWEVIIGINGHPHNSFTETTAINIVNKYNPNTTYNIKIIYYDTKGKPMTLNKMIDDCNYDYIALLDVDDIWLPEKLELQVPYLNNYDVVGTHCKYFGDVSYCPNIPFGDLSNFNFLIVNPIINSSSIIKKELAKWKDDFFGVEDYNLWLDLSFQKKKFYNLDKILCLHRIYKESFFNNTNNNYVEALKNKYK